MINVKIILLFCYFVKSHSVIEAIFITVLGKKMWSPVRFKATVSKRAAAYRTNGPHDVRPVSAAVSIVKRAYRENKQATKYNNWWRDKSSSDNLYLITSRLLDTDKLFPQTYDLIFIKKLSIILYYSHKYIIFIKLEQQSISILSLRLENYGKGNKFTKKYGRRINKRN